MNMHDFDNRLRSLFNIDAWELPALPNINWDEFLKNPVIFFLHAKTDAREAIWNMVQHRCRKYDKGDAQ